MGIFTKIILQTIRVAGSGSYFGVCEICSMNVSETFFSNSYLVFKKIDAEIYYFGGSSSNKGVYGHEKCIRLQYQNALNITNFNRIGNLKIIPVKNQQELIDLQNKKI